MTNDNPRKTDDSQSIEQNDGDFEYADDVQPADPERQQRKAAQAPQASGDGPTGNIPEHAKLSEDEKFEKVDESLAEAEEFFVTRDDEGKIRPVRTQAAGFGEVEIRPMNYGQAETYFGDAGGAADVQPETVAQILRRHVIAPDLEDYCQRKYGKVEHGQTHYLNGTIIREEMKPFGPQAFMNALLRESGMAGASVTVNEDGTAEVDFESGNR